MKRVIFILMCGLAFSSTLKAQDTDTLRFDRLIIKGPGDDGGGELIIPKSPVSSPSIIQSGHTLYIISGCDDTELSLVDENDDEEYSITILAGTTMITLPEWLQGTYELRILRGQYMFYTEIDL